MVRAEIEGPWVIKVVGCVRVGEKKKRESSFIGSRRCTDWCGCAQCICCEMCSVYKNMCKCYVVFHIPVAFVDWQMVVVALFQVIIEFVALPLVTLSDGFQAALLE